MSNQPVKRALLSVSDKSGLVEFARFLSEQGVEILSTGGSAKAIAEAGIAVTEVSNHTGFPEIMDGRVKTLHPKIHGGLLAVRDDDAHRKAMEEHAIAPIDLVAINLYPFEETVARGAAFATTIENIDIGGPSMIRSAAKNHAYVTVVTDAADYATVMDEMRAHDGTVTEETRRRLAAKAFARTASYDAAISGWFARELDEPFPERMTLAATRRQVLRYGENPHQTAAFYVDGSDRPGIATAAQVQGKELSYNNLNDTDAAVELVAELSQQGARPAVAIIKHANPCGAALGNSLIDAYEKALRCDPVSAFGGIVALGGPIDEATATKITEIFTEVVIAPGADDAAKAVFAKKKNLRLLLTDSLPDPAAPSMTVRTVAGGYLLQNRDAAVIAESDLKVVTKKAPDAREVADLLFAFSVAKHVKSNAIVYARDGATVGIGAGQMSRVDSSRIAAQKSSEAAEAAGLPEPVAKGAVVASDAFFPFPDGLLAAAEAGVTAVIQPGGSMRDDAVIAAADEAGLAMVMTGRRHFRH